MNQKTNSIIVVTKLVYDTINLDNDNKISNNR